MKMGETHKPRTIILLSLLSVILLSFELGFAQNLTIQLNTLKSLGCKGLLGLCIGSKGELYAAWRGWGKDYNLAIAKIAVNGEKIYVVSMLESEKELYVNKMGAREMPVSAALLEEREGNLVVVTRANIPTAETGFLKIFMLNSKGVKKGNILEATWPVDSPLHISKDNWGYIHLLSLERDWWEHYKIVAEASGVRLIQSTGTYYNSFLPRDFMPLNNVGEAEYSGFTMIDPSMALVCVGVKSQFPGIVDPRKLTPSEAKLKTDSVSVLLIEPEKKGERDLNEFGLRIDLWGFVRASRIYLPNVASKVYEGIYLPHAGFFSGEEGKWYYFVNSGEQINRVYQVIFDKQGNYVRPKQVVKAKVRSISELPLNIMRFTKFRLSETSGKATPTVYQWGCDSRGELYWDVITWEP